jgi:hypothetical protein
MACPYDGMEDTLKNAIINKKANACPMIIRLAWHASGTFDKGNGTGGSDGSTMRYEKEYTDGANAGLQISQDMLKPVKNTHVEASNADIWTYAGAKAVEFMGGPKIPHTFCRTDAADDTGCPENGRLPDAAQGAQHLRDVFYRQGFDDKDIVALSGAHTVGRCHLSRSGFDGPWTHTPLKFNNEYFRNLIELEWKLSDRTGPGGNVQYEDVGTGKLMMLPTDMAIKTDPAFVQYAREYAKDEELFFKDFRSAFARLLANGTAQSPDTVSVDPEEQRALASKEFREQSMHGSQQKVLQYMPQADVHEVEAGSSRSALHKAAFWGHTHLMPILLEQAKIDPNLQDSEGDTALHDASRFGHTEVVEKLVAFGADRDIKNNQGQTATDVAILFDKQDTVAYYAKL